MSSTSPAASSTRSLLEDLRALGEGRAPASLHPAVMAELGLADAYAQVDSLVGPVFVAYNRRGISAVERASDGAAFQAAFRARFGREARPVERLPESLRRSLAEALAGGRRARLSFDLSGLTEFEQAVLRKALDIPRGEVRPYAWIAREIGHPRAVRAVGSALRRNPIPLLIPCHRVVRSDGHIGQYALGGETVKRSLLVGEGVELEALEGAERYRGCATTRIFCFPTCRHARRVSPRYRVPFSSPAAATAAGYRPCKVCRPAAA